jgi:hypothetical protein
VFIDFKIAYDSMKIEVFFSILKGSGVLMKLIRLIKMCINETHSKVQIGKDLSDNFPVK